MRRNGQHAQMTAAPAGSGPAPAPVAGNNVTAAAPPPAPADTTAASSAVNPPPLMSPPAAAPTVASAPALPPPPASFLTSSPAAGVQQAAIPSVDVHQEPSVRHLLWRLASSLPLRRPVCKAACLLRLWHSCFVVSTASTVLTLLCVSAHRHDVICKRPDGEQFDASSRSNTLQCTP